MPGDTAPSKSPNPADNETVPLQETKMKAKLAIAAALITAALGSGCAIHSQAPIREVAYDFSDFEFYDRAYAPSPEYQDAEVAEAAALSERSAQDEPAY
jgi:hypothetical protein